MTTLALIAALTTATPTFAAADDNVCNSDGKTTTLNGKTHTCGTCSSGASEPTRMWFVGDLSAADAVAACECYTDKSACTDSSSKIVAATRNQKATQKKSTGGKTKAR